MEKKNKRSYAANFHTHCYLDDGIGTLEEYVMAAKQTDLTALGFSCHTPMPFSDDWHMAPEDFPVYCREISRLHKASTASIELYTGLELDYLEDSGILAGMEYVPDIDYCLASVHYMKNIKTNTYLTIDGPVEEFESLLQDNFNGDIKAMVEYYFASEKKLMQNHNFDILGHCDLIKKRNTNNRFFNENEAWYREMAFDMLHTAKKYQVRIEVNTGGIARGATKEVYPAPWMLEYCAELQIPVVLNSDAHNPEHLDFYFTQALKDISAAGYTSITYLEGGKWVYMPLELL